MNQNTTPKETFVYGNLAYDKGIISNQFRKIRFIKKCCWANGYIKIRKILFFCIIN